MNDKGSHWKLFKLQGELKDLILGGSGYKVANNKVAKLQSSQRDKVAKLQSSQRNKVAKLQSSQVTK